MYLKKIKKKRRESNVVTSKLLWKYNFMWLVLSRQNWIYVFLTNSSIQQFVTYHHQIETKLWVDVKRDESVDTTYFYTLILAFFPSNFVVDDHLGSCAIRVTWLLDCNNFVNVYCEIIGHINCPHVSHSDAIYLGMVFYL